MLFKPCRDSLGRVLFLGSACEVGGGLVSRVFVGAADDAEAGLPSRTPDFTPASLLLAIFRRMLSSAAGIHVNKGEDSEEESVAYVRLLKGINGLDLSTREGAVLPESRFHLNLSLCLL